MKYKSSVISTAIIVFISCLSMNVFGANHGGSPETVHFKQHTHQAVAMAGEVDLMHVNSSFNPILLSTEPDQRSDYRSSHIPMQTSQPSPYFHEDKPAGQSENKTASENMPSVINQFDGSNGYPDHPPDNFLAISKSGYIISVMNSNYRIFQPNNSGTSSNVSFYDALKTTFPNFKEVYFDPRVEYDAVNDRFIMTMLSGTNTPASEIVIMFSKSGNPADGWYVYSIPSDLYNQQQFGDYPTIGISKSDLFISLHLIHVYPITGAYSSTPAIVQINLANGYKGDSLNYVSYAPDGTNFYVTDTWVPVPHGIQGNYGDSMYFVSNHDTIGSEVDLLEITGNENSGKAKINIDTTYMYPSLYYSAPHLVGEKQDTTTFKLNPDQNWITQAFYGGHTIHFVFSTKDQHSGFTDIIYARIDAQKKKLNYVEFGLNKMDYVYSSIAPIGISDTDKSVLISYCKSDSVIYPEVDVVECDNNFNFSPSVVIKAGSSPIVSYGQKSGTVRWGDYTGLVRQVGTNYCYFSGSYGSSNTYETTVAKIGLVKNSGINESQVKTNNNSSVFPNPVTDIFTIDFDLKQRSDISIAVYDMSGRMIEMLYKGLTEAGDQRFSFNKAALKPGVYSLSIQRDGDETISKKIVVE